MTRGRPLPAPPSTIKAGLVPALFCLGDADGRGGYRAGLDLVMHFDVLEHIPGPVAALEQCWRILRPGGRLLFSCPFYEELNRSVFRARMEDGQLLHDLPPCYHRNAVDGDGALVFTQFGWDLLDMIERSGFVELELWLNFDPVEGVLSNGCPFPDGHAWPIVFAARKPINSN